MKIEADDKELQDIFSLGYFKIPRFQRPYSWELDEVESFWSDITNEAEDSYFIGSMVVYQTKRPYFGIVDGQQRLTTITLLLSAIRNGFISLGEENLAKGVHKYIEKANIDNEDEFVVKAESSFPYLQSHIQKYDGYKIKCDVGTEEKKLESAFALLTNKLHKLIPELQNEPQVQSLLFPNHEADPVTVLKSIRDKVLSLKLVFIQLDNEDDAYLIFETLNARGRDLTTADLIKNLVLKKLKTKSTALDTAKESWNRLVKQFDETNDERVLDTFLLHYWLSNHGYTTDKKLFSEVKTFVSSSEKSAEILIQRLNESAPLYSISINPLNSKWEKSHLDIRDLLLSLKYFNVKQQSSMVLSLLRAHEKKVLNLKGLKKALSKIVSFHYAFNSITSQRSSGSISTNYSRIACLLSDAKSHDEVQRVMNQLDIFLKSKFPAMSEFIVKFQELEYLNKRTKHRPSIVHALKLILQSSSNGLSIDFANLSIEHIIPQSFSNESEEVIASIGNLLLIDSKTNSEELKDLSPNEKLEILSNKSYPLTESLIISKQFDEGTAWARSKKIAEKVYALLKNNIFN